MHFFAIIGLAIAFAIAAPRAASIFTLLVGPPVLGLAVGGFAWSIAAMLFNGLINLQTFAMFVLGGTLLSLLVIVRTS